MFAAGFGTVSIAALLSAGAFLIPSPDMKCGRPAPDTKPLLAVDGVLVDATPENPGFARGDVMQIQIVCMNPRDSTFNRSAGHPVVSVWTKHGPATQMQAPLSIIAAEQQSHHRRHSSYVTDLGQIDLTGVPPIIEVSMEVTENGWLAVARIARYFHSCTVYGGEPPERDRHRPAGHIRCTSH